MERRHHHGRETAYRLADRGAAGPTVLLVHGSGGSHEAWRGQFRLGDEFAVAALDLSGHGESDDVDADPGFTTLSAYADDVLAVADAVDADALVGHSLGGAVALHAVIERDWEPSALGLVGTGARLAVLEDLRVWLADDFDRAVEFLHDPGRLFFDPSGAELAASREAMQACGRATVERDFLTCHRFDVRDELDAVTPPALAVTGEYDPLTPPRYHEYLAAELPDCRFDAVPDAAHMSMLERPERFNDLLGSFLGEHA